MPQSLVQIYLHIVFSTKRRHPYLKDKTLQEKLHAYMSGICNNLDCTALKIGGIDNHVHLLTRHSKNLAISDFMRELKRSSSTWLKTQSQELSSFHWQNGYGVFSISQSHVEVAKKYITNQKQHHAKTSFKKEFIELLKKYSIEYDKRYVWDQILDNAPLELKYY